MRNIRGRQQTLTQTTVPAFDAIRGHKSAYNRQGQSSKGKEFGKNNPYAFFCYRPSDGRTLHLPLRVDDNTSVILENTL